jgi:FlaA1/EpsC-like NDP-sugar epimerase
MLSINDIPVFSVVYNSLLQLIFGIYAWVIFNINKKVIRYFNSNDYLNLMLIIVLIHVSTLLMSLTFPEKYHLKPEIFFISFFITSIYIIATRFLISYLYFFYNNPRSVKSQKKLLIYGAGELGNFIKKSIDTHYKGAYKLIAFLDDDIQKIGRYVGETIVLNPSNNINKIIQDNEITDIIIANKTLHPTKKSQFLENAIAANVRIKEISSIQSFFGADFNFEKLESIEIQDLLNREPIVLFDEHVAEELTNKTVLVTGAAGSIGSEIVRKLAEHNASLIICVDFSESALYDLQQELLYKHSSKRLRFILLDIRNQHRMEELFKEYSPDFVYHAAAYKHVPLMELFPWEGIQTNVIATAKLAQIAIQYNAKKFVFISSDKAVNPTSIMGATKKLAEIIVQTYAAQHTSTSFIITRFGNVLGSNGSVVPLFKKQIKKGGPITVTHPEMIRYFMTISEACQLVLEASIVGEKGDVFVFDMGSPVKILDLAKNMIRLAGYQPDVEIKIEFTGQRPGEKLFEELFSSNELLQRTQHEKLMISKNNTIHNFGLDEILKKLLLLEGNYNPDAYKKLMKELIPEFNYINEKY